MRKDISSLSRRSVYETTVKNLRANVAKKVQELNVRLMDFDIDTASPQVGKMVTELLRLGGKVQKGGKLYVGKGSKLRKQALQEYSLKLSAFLSTDNETPIGKQKRSAEEEKQFEAFRKNHPEYFKPESTYEEQLEDYKEMIDAIKPLQSALEGKDTKASNQINDMYARCRRQGMKTTDIVDAVNNFRNNYTPSQYEKLTPEQIFDGLYSELGISDDND